ncbi:voltage-gated potassium channel Kch [Cryobacterium mesophilum]|nr:NAD-binding protein [Terrimesophilobacter mesophilus]MBB5633813.1 voltage-gated potassium channel Kch [Terrimesophilobacter mesophilus]
MPQRGASSTRLRDRYRYWFDNVMARGTIAVMGLLGLATIAFVVVIAVIVVVFGMFPRGEHSLTFFEVLWGNLMRTLDPGTMGADQGWAFRVAMLVVTIGGLIIVASLIGIVSSAFDAKIDQLRKGRSRVLETDHTLILGWSQKVLPIVSEICIANESRRRPAIVILSDRDKVELEDELKAHVPHTMGTRIIVRKGDPMDLGDLELGNPHTARSIILIAPEESDDPDSVVIKMALALTNNPRRGPRRLDIVGELQESRNLEAARLVGHDEASWVLARDLISRITVQTCRQSGLSGVYTELLDFDGDELYIAEEPTLTGRTYFDAQLSFPDSSVIGVVSGDDVLLNPDAAREIVTGERLIHIASDDSAIRVGTVVVPDVAAISDEPDSPRSAEHTLVLGYNSDLVTIVRELNEYVPPESSVTVVADIEGPRLPQLTNLDIRFVRGDTTSRAVLDDLDIPGFDHIIVLAYKELIGGQRADAKTLVTLLHLREIGEQSGRELNIVSEMIDDRNREIAEVTKANDFIVSDKLISLALSQLSENRVLAHVFDSLFTSEGSEIYLRPAQRYIREGETVNFYTVLESARRRGETAIGYRISEHAHDASRGYGVRLNPLKSDSIRFAPADKVIVLAED